MSTREHKELRSKAAALRSNSTDGDDVERRLTTGINEGDQERVEVWSRLIAREIKHEGTDSYFAGTPTLALVRYVT